MTTQGINYTVNIVLCIDSTGSMRDIIERVKKSALRFYEDLSERMQEKNKIINSLRVRVISFRDYYVDGDRAMIASAFFLLPQDRDAFTAFVNTINADGGGDDPENGLEALALAMRSAWSSTGDRRRQVIVVWTDTSVHQLEKNAGAKPSNYPQDMPQNLDQLTDMWEGQDFMNKSAKRLIIYAPEAYAWKNIADSWENIIQFPSKAGEGLADQDYQVILDQISESV